MNWWDYANTENPDKYNEDAIKIAVERENDRDIVFASCLNPFTLFEKINLPSKIEKTYCISLTCSNEEIIRRLKERDQVECVVVMNSLKDKSTIINGLSKMLINFNCILIIRI